MNRPRIADEEIEKLRQLGQAVTLVLLPPGSASKSGLLPRLLDEIITLRAERDGWKRAAHEAHEEELAATRALEVERAKNAEARAVLERIAVAWKTCDTLGNLSRCEADSRALLAKWDATPTRPAVRLAEVLAIVREQPCSPEASIAVRQQWVLDEVVRRLLSLVGEVP